MTKQCEILMEMGLQARSCTIKKNNFFQKIPNGPRMISSPFIFSIPFTYMVLIFFNHSEQRKRLAKVIVINDITMTKKMEKAIMMTALLFLAFFGSCTAKNAFTPRSTSNSPVHIHDDQLRPIHRKVVNFSPDRSHIDVIASISPKSSTSGVKSARDPWYFSIVPIHLKEMAKFLSLSMMMFWIVFIFTMTRDTKDALIVTTCGSEAIAFLKVTPSP